MARQIPHYPDGRNIVQKKNKISVERGKFREVKSDSDMRKELIV